MRGLTRIIRKSGIQKELCLILLLCGLIGYVALYSPGKSCTIFTAIQDDLVIYGNSEDQHNANPVIGFFPPSSEGFGSVQFGITVKDGQPNFEGGVNDQGLAWDVNSTPRTELEPDPNPGKPDCYDENFLYRITKRAATVEQAIQIVKRCQFGEAMTCQYHIADASGDAVVISGGPDGKVAYTRIGPEDNYLLSTNFNLAQPDKGPVDFRWHTATEMLQALDRGEILTPEYAMDLMESVHLETLTTFTLYQNVLDLNADRIYLSYMSQYNETAVIDMQDEFKKGQRVVEMREFFSPETAAAGDAAYRAFELRFKAAVVGVITLGVLLIAGLVFLVIRKMRNYQATKGTA